MSGVPVEGGGPSAPPVAGDGSGSSSPHLMVGTLSSAPPAAPTGAASAPLDPLVGILHSALRCAVTLVFIADDGSPYKDAHYGTGVIVFCHGNHSFIFTKCIWGEEEDKNVSIGVQFYGCDVEVESPQALMLSRHAGYMVLHVRDDQNLGRAITFPQHPATVEKCCTIGTMSGTKMHAESPSPLVEFRARLGTYFGKVIIPNCSASPHSSASPGSGGYPYPPRKSTKLVEKSRTYFQLTCPFKDVLVNFHNIDLPHDIHTCTSILGAPVFSSHGHTIGVISSTSTAYDVKYGLHVNEIIEVINNMFLQIFDIIQGEEDRNRTWMDKLLAIYVDKCGDDDLDH